MTEETSSKDQPDQKPQALPVPVPANKDTMQKMLQAGLHYGHRASSWNPRMKEYIYTERGGMHIVDITKTIDLLNDACRFLKEAAGKGDVVFVATKKQAQNIVEGAARRAGAFYVTKRWPGGLITNFKTLKKSVDKLNDLAKTFEEGIENRTKKELMLMKKQLRRLVALYGGVRKIKGYPKAVVVVDTKVERIAVREAIKMKIPVVALMDTNSDPRPIRYPIPGNDDATKSISLVINTLAEAVKEGNKGRGVEHEDIDFKKIDERIEAILEEERKKRKEELKIRKDKPKVLKRGAKKPVKIIRKADSDKSVTKDVKKVSKRATAKKVTAKKTAKKKAKKQTEKPAKGKKDKKVVKKPAKKKKAKVKKSTKSKKKAAKKTKK